MIWPLRRPPVSLDLVRRILRYPEDVGTEQHHNTIQVQDQIPNLLPLPTAGTVRGILITLGIYDKAAYGNVRKKRKKTIRNLQTTVGRVFYKASHVNSGVCVGMACAQLHVCTLMSKETEGQVWWPALSFSTLFSWDRVSH